MEVLRAVALVLATMSMGLMAGVFGLYAHTVMPGLRRTDDRTFVGAFQALDRAIINPWFMVGGFMGALVLTLAAAALHLGVAPVLPWTLAGLALYGAVVVITFRVHLPRNNAIKAVGDPDGIADLAAVRARFDEALWSRWNVVRTLLTTAAFACLAWALVERGAAG
jgi:uncharacterized membrane protein